MPWNRSLFARLLVPYLATFAAVAAISYAYTDAVVERLYVESLANAVQRQARLVGELLPWELHGAAMDARCAALRDAIDARVTVIAPDGVVLGDSDAPSEQLENHRDRPEVLAALRGDAGQSVRDSASVGRRLFYCAWQQVNAGKQRIIRLAVPIATVESARAHIRWAIWSGLAVAAIAALWPAVWFSRRLSNRMTRASQFSTAVARGVPAQRLVPEGDDDMGRLETNLLAMSDSLSAQLQTAREEQAKLAAVLRGMVEGVLVVDRAGMIRLSNRRAEQIFDVPPGASLVGQPLITVSRDPDLHALLHSVTRAEVESPAVREITLEGAQRESLQVTATPIEEADAAPQLFIVVFHNITALKKLEATRRDFVANVSHELRTPLTAVQGYAETLMGSAAEDPALVRKFVAVIERHSERLARLIDDLLVLSDLELGRTELHPVTMPLRPAVDAAIEVVREKARRGEVDVSCEVPADLPPLHADPDRVEQVLVNLIDNAVKYTPSGGHVQVAASVVGEPENGASPARDRGPGHWIGITVSDTGIGVPKHELPRLTERFYRVDKARSRELGGTGLGLAIVKHIVQAHGGALRIDSEVGRGTTVHVYLPAAEPTPVR